MRPALTTTNTVENSWVKTNAKTDPKIRAAPIAVMGMSHAGCLLAKAMTPMVSNPAQTRKG
jgi:hypothetical protein